MGEVHSTPQEYTVFEEPQESGKKTLFAQISEDIGSGNEGDMIDMQCKTMLDSGSPHLWPSYGSQSTTGSAEHFSAYLSSEPNELMKRSKTTHEDLRFSDEDSLIDEKTFSQELQRSYTEVPIGSHPVIKHKR